ncbi:MAG: type II toxin-antitoxin system VapC family toxin [Burkholderiaceae bacterium]|nr:type II toxin-antitoxin system VapC family toxin [Burkholderiaceae bacterium]MDZ4145417.1 type II toxin-antitoxin system VapC family toxin [Burkholderiales bacterium]
MFLLDTNVVSELRKAATGKADTKVVTWAASVPAQLQFISVISVFELEYGVRLKEHSDPAQGAVLRRWLDTQVLPAFKDRTLPVDVSVALKCAPIHVPNRCKERDAFIAATAMVRGMTVVTRDTSDFAPTGATLFNPWA